MKTKIIYSILCVSMFLSVTSCTDNYENFPVDYFTYDYVFSTTDSLGRESIRFLNSIYEYIPNGHNSIDGDYLDAATDDAVSIKQNDPDIYQVAIGRYSANNRIGSLMNWSKYYEGIRKVNIIVNNIDVVPFKQTFRNIDGEIKPFNVTVKAEARFLRALLYFELIKRYGGVPIIEDNVFDINDDVELPRNSFSDCIDYVVSELDDIYKDLRSITMSNPEEYAHAATAEAVTALKSRVLLYSASPLFNEKPVATNSSELRELVGHAEYKKERWKIAADEARRFIESFGHNGNKSVGLTKNFVNVFLNFYSKEANPEVIFFRQEGQSKQIETNNGPLGFTGNAQGNGRTNPTQNLINSFPMKDGSKIGESSKYNYDAQKPYENRDPRLTYTILHNGSNWLNTSLETFQGGANNPTNSAEYTRTSYYMRKFMGDFTNNSEYGNNYHLWVLFRYAEILLNFAEAENEYLDSPSDEVYEAIIMLRERAGIESGDNNMYGLKSNMSKEEMREVIHNERRIEMAFEEHRFWDIRRLRLAETVFKEPLQGALVTKSLSDTSYSDIDIYEIPFNEKMYLFPLPYSEVNKNDNLKQNPNW